MARSPARTCWSSTRSTMSSRRVAVVALLLSLAAAAGAQTRFDDIRATGVLYGGIITQDNYPFVYRGQGGDWVGYEIDLLQQAADVLGVTLSLRTYGDQQALQEAVARSAVDLAFSKILRDPANSQLNFQTVPVAELGMVIVVNRVAYSRLRTSGDLIEDLQTGAFAVSIPDDPVFERELLRLYPDIRVDRMDPGTDMWCCIERGEQIALALDGASVYHYFSRFPERGIFLRVVPVNATATVVGLVPWRFERFWEWMNILIEGQGNPATLDDLRGRFLTGFEPRSDT